jgi:hypothetical protein
MHITLPQFRHTSPKLRPRILSSMSSPRILPCMCHILRHWSALWSFSHGVRAPSVSPIVAKLPAVETIVSVHDVRVVALGTLIVESETIGATVAGKEDGAKIFILVLIGVMVKPLFWIWDWGSCSWVACLRSGQMWYICGRRK